MSIQDLLFLAMWRNKGFYQKEDFDFGKKAESDIPPSPIISAAVYFEVWELLKLGRAVC